MIQLGTMKRNILGTLSLSIKLPRARKEQEFTAYPMSSNDDKTKVKLQSSTRIGYLHLKTGLFQCTKSFPNGAYNHHLMMTELIDYQFDTKQLDEIRLNLAATAGKKVGSIMLSDNSGANQIF